MRILKILVAFGGGAPRSGRWRQKSKETIPIKGGHWSLFAAVICKILISPEAEVGESLELPALLVSLVLERSFCFV